MTTIEFALFLKSKLPTDVADLIQQNIRENAANTIISYWRKNISELNIALVEFCKQNKYYPISQTDINLIFALKKASKNRTITIDYMFWINILRRMYCGLVSTRVVTIDNNEYNDIKFLLFYGKLINHLLAYLNIKMSEGRYRHFEE